MIVVHILTYVHHAIKNGESFATCSLSENEASSGGERIIRGRVKMTTHFADGRRIKLTPPSEDEWSLRYIVLDVSGISEEKVAAAQTEVVNKTLMREDQHPPPKIRRFAINNKLSELLFYLYSYHL